MDELEKGLSISVSGKLRQEALAASNEHFQKWNITMPNVEPLVLDFGLGDFYKVGHIEYWIANENQAGYCAKCLFVFDGQTCPMHSHKEKHETFFIVKGSVKITLDEQIKEMHSGDVLSVNYGQSHSFTGIGPALLLEVSKPCVIDDNYFENPDIPIGGNYHK